MHRVMYRRSPLRPSNRIRWHGRCGRVTKEGFVAMLRIGTSGWVYKHWRDRFYPRGVRASDLLSFYAHEFDTVEINYSFYRLPTLENFVAWRDQTPKDFVFAVKASRYLTHMKKLKDAAPALEKLFSRAEGLEEKLGPILFQFPAKWPLHLDRLVPFLELLPPGRRYAFEFRDSTWFAPETFRALEAHDAGLCIADRGGQSGPLQVTSDFVYVRMHAGRDVSGCYSGTELQRWADRVEEWTGRGLDVYLYFNNDWNGFAVMNARQLLENLQGNPSPD